MRASRGKPTRLLFVLIDCFGGNFAISPISKLGTFAKYVMAIFIGLLRTLARRGPEVAFGSALLLLIFTLGIGAGHYEWLPYRLWSDSRKTVLALRYGVFEWPFAQFVGLSQFNTAEIPENRIKSLLPNTHSDHFIVNGGAYEFREYCPEYGCLAVEFSHSGKFIRAIPFLPNEFNRPMIVRPRERSLLFTFPKNVMTTVSAVLPNGDIILSLQYANTFPYGGGNARVRPNGHVVWYRDEYSHHWATLANGREILTPAQEVERGDIRVPLADGKFDDVACRTKIRYKDMISIIDLEGRLIDRINLEDALLRSPFRGHLVETVAGCDATHANYSIRVGAALAAKFTDVSPDDILVSMRNISALVIVRRKDHAVTHFIKGTFAFQHSAQPMPDGRILIFDDYGSSATGMPSRVMTYDPSTGEEKTIFPTLYTDPRAKVFTRLAGHLAVSADGKRIIASFTQAGIAYEFLVVDGSIITVFDNLHNMQSIPNYPGHGTGKAARVEILSVLYQPSRESVPSQQAVGDRR